MIKNYFYTFMLCCQVFTMQVFANPYSKEKSIMFNSEKNEIKSKSTPNVDFFASKKMLDELLKKNRYENALRVHEESLHTSIMNNYEKTQYFLKRNDMNALKFIENQKHMQHLEKANNQGLISTKEYGRQLSNPNPSFSNQYNKS